MQGGLWGRWRCLALSCLLWGLAPDAVQARIETGGISVSALGSEGGEGAQIGLTEHQVRQLLSAEATVQEALLMRMVSQINAELQRNEGRGQAVPEQMVAAWLRDLLARKVAAKDWSAHLEEWVTTYGVLRRRLSSSVAQRVGIDDGLIRANAALATGDLRAADTWLDGEVRALDTALDGASTDVRSAKAQDLSNLLMARGLVNALQGDAEAAKRLLLRASALHKAEDPDRPALLLLAGSASAVAGSRGGMVEVAEAIRSQAEAVLARNAGDKAWRRALWFAQIWTGTDALEDRDFQSAMTAFSSASTLAPDLSGSHRTEWTGIWLSHFVLAALLQDEASTEKRRFHQTEAIRLGREMTERRPDWPVAWHVRALSGLMAAGIAVDQQVREPRMPYLQDALLALEHMASLGSDASSALETRFQLLMLLQHEYLVQGNEAKSQELSKQVATADAELQRRGVQTSKPENDALLYRIKVQEAELLRQKGLPVRSLAVLSEALLVADRNQGDGWAIEGWRVHTLLADAADASEQMQKAQLHRRKAVLKAELEAGKVGARIEWPALLWQSLFRLSNLLGKQNLTEEALRTSEKALALARREAAKEPVYAAWHHREFRTLMASTDFLRQRGTAVMGRYEEAARLPGSRYEASEPVGSAAEDLWTVMNTMGSERFKQGELEPATAAHHEALQIAQRALDAEPLSDDWLNRAASSHTGLADAAQARQARLLEATHRYSAVDLSGRRSATTLASPGDQREHWLRLYYLAKVQQDLNLHRDAMGSLTLARALARRFAEQLPNDRFWQEYLWFSEQEIGSMKKPPQDASSAEGALVAAAAVAGSMIAKGHDFKQWGDRAADSLEALAREHRQQGREVDARRASVQASGYRSKLQAMEREAQVRAEVKQHVNGLLDALTLTAERADALSKAELMTRLQVAIDQTTDAAMKTGMDGVQSERLNRLQNALFVVRQLPGP